MATQAPGEPPGCKGQPVGMLTDAASCQDQGVLRLGSNERPFAAPFYEISELCGRGPVSLFTILAARLCAGRPATGH